MNTFFSIKNRLFLPALVSLMIAVALLCLFPAHSIADTASDITASFTITAPGKDKITRLHDDSYQNKWTSAKVKAPAVTFTSNNGEMAYGLYICFAKMPESWGIQTPVGDEWATLLYGDNSFMHAYVFLPGVTHFRLVALTETEDTLEIFELCVLSDGPLPGWVQLWEPPAEKADMLLLIARPGNEWRFMGGILPEYAVERGMNVLTVFMTCANQTLMSEMLNSLWFSGYRNYPLLGGFPDSKESSVTKLYKVWDTTAVRRFVMEVVRKYQPEVIVTHDISKGENDNAVNKVCAEMAAFCFGNADNSAIEPYLYELYGGWQPKKLYIHLYGQNSVKMDWRIPLNRLHGQTAIETAQEAFKLYASQKSLKITISDADSFKFSNALFGLYATRVGPDNHRNDLMENIPGLGVITFVPPDDVLHADTNQNRSPALNADWYAGAGKRNEKGFLEAGEFILENDAAGLWFYASPTLIVRIDRMRNTTAKKTWYEAHMYVDLESRERIGSVLYVPEVSGRTHTQITRIAKENHVVFGLSTDYYTYRTGVKDATVGVVIRGGRILHDSAPARNRSKFPNLDTLAMFGDGNWGVYYSDEYTAADYLAMGAVDVFSFGPILVRDGMINPFIDEMYGGKTGQPRCALGMIEAGHYYAMLEEGRFKKDAVGTSLKDLAIHMHQKGCRLALNLDGGQTAVYTFMGKQITRIAVYQPNGYDLPRATSELIAAGFSASVDP